MVLDALRGGTRGVAVRALDRDLLAIIKVPERELTFVVLGNTDALSAPYPLGSGRLETSPRAREFLDAFVIGSVPPPGR